VTPHMRDYMEGRIDSAEYMRRVKEDVNRDMALWAKSMEARYPMPKPFAFPIVRRWASWLSRKIR